MIDVCGNDGAAARDFCPHKLGCYLVRDVGTETFAYDVDGEANCGLCTKKELSSRSLHAANFDSLLPSQIFSDRDEFHFRRDDSLACIPKLRDRMTSRCSKWLRLRGAVSYFLTFIPSYLHRFPFALAR